MQGAAITIAAPGVLGNDKAAEGHVLSALLSKDASHGKLTLNGDGSFTYTPQSTFTGVDTFIYQAVQNVVPVPATAALGDGTAMAAPGAPLGSDNPNLFGGFAVVTITVKPPAAPPEAHDDFYVTPQDKVLSITAPGVLANDKGPDGHTLNTKLNSDVAHGTLKLNTDGSFSYTPKDGYFGGDSFSYFAIDTTVTPPPADRKSTRLNSSHRT